MPKPSKPARRATRSKNLVRKPAMAAYCPRPDLGAPADGYFAKIPAPLKAVAAQLRRIVRSAAPAASEAIKWGTPVFEHRGMLCYIRAQSAYVTLGFYEQGIHLADPKGLLEGTGDNMRHVKVRSAAEVHADLYTKWVKQAVAINERSRA